MNSNNTVPFSASAIYGYIANILATPIGWWTLGCATAVDIQAVDGAGAMILPQKRRDSRPVPDKLLWITITKNVVRRGPRVSSCVGDGCNVKNGFCHFGFNVVLFLFSALLVAIFFGSVVTQVVFVPYLLLSLSY